MVVFPWKTPGYAANSAMILQLSPNAVEKKTEDPSKSALMVKSQKCPQVWDLDSCQKAKVYNTSDRSNILYRTAQESLALTLGHQPSNLVG